MVKALSQNPLGPRPRRHVVQTTLAALREVLDGLRDGTTVAVLLTRPGKGLISDADWQWATMLTEVAVEVGIPIDPVFRANDQALIQLDPIISARS